MRLLTLLAAGLLIAGCNNSSKAKEDTKDTVQSIKQMPPAVPDTIFTGFGTEPFWSVYIVKDSKIVFHPVNALDVELPFTTPSGSAESEMTYTSQAGHDNIEIKIIKKNCSDGMSEDIHPYEVQVVLNKIAYKGCGRDGK